ncbi:hypothetical protein BMS3Abin05_00960 [bacterium BMS3Abin05]|nr:hypothetical protein BMS3Abin05_00960 [bacterium BMS3Abin05]GBE27268.1 hypothetical protein BMS3Bbin03_01192 [bacterium BMS3Bbin03]HDL78860.1 DUF47 family protein [Bacteroidota bacterium]HDZ11896.1 DUF47 family protein [Bacteroidota bacterium]
MAVLFKRIHELEVQIDQYLDTVLKGALLFRQGIRFYLEKRLDEFTQRLNTLNALESEADALRRQIENTLYARTLIPDSRGDVLGLLESTDAVLNTATETLIQFSVQKPEIFTEFTQAYLDLTESSMNAMEEMVKAIRAYFKDLNAIRDHANKVMFYEEESDKISEKMLDDLFNTKRSLSKKLHMRDFIDNVENIADETEDVCDRLAIAAIKRNI